MSTRVTLILAAAVLAAAVGCSLAFGSRSVPINAIMAAFTDYDPSLNDHVIIRELRLPRTLIGLLAGMSLGLAGVLMQGLTRNPLADPGILGVNGGAALAVVLAIGLLGLDTPQGYIWFAFLGAAIASIAVFAIASVGSGGATPFKLTMAGVAIGAVLASITTAFLLLDSATFDVFRFWQVGSLSGRSQDEVYALGPFMLFGAGIALLLGPLLNALALGEETATSLGQNVPIARAIIAVAVVILCGAATSAAGPIGFLGLVVPHMARYFAGTDYRAVLPISMLFGPALLLLADVAGRLIAIPSEVQVGILTVALGAPLFIFLVRRKRLDTL